MKANLSVNKIFDVFKSFSDETDFSEYRLLCTHAGRAITARLCRADDITSYEDDLCYAAGCLAFYRYVLINGADNTAVYKAGDISIQNKPSYAVNHAKLLLDDALLNIKHLLKDSSFCFKTI